MNIYNDDGFGSRLADAIMNESYYSGIEDEKIIQLKFFIHLSPRLVWKDNPSLVGQ